jgi:hypothetical protein
MKLLLQTVYDVENGAHLLDSDAREQLHKLIDPNPVFEVLKES